MINKNKIIKYAEFIKESLDPNKLKSNIKAFNRIKDDVYTIHGDLKELSNSLYEELINITLPYHKLIVFGGIEFDVIINKTNKYHSSIDWNKFLNNDFEIIIEVPNNYDINYLISIIIHEFRHIIDFTDENLNNGLSSFDMELNLRKYNIPKFNDFFILIYISLEHELVARNNQIYPYIKFNNLKKDESLQILKTSFIWKALNELEKFNVDIFISRFEITELINITNEFIKDVLYDNDTKIESYNELKNFYNLFDEYFNDVSKKWKELLLKEVDYTYERKTFNINQNCIDGYKNVLKEIWNKLKNDIN